MRVRSCVSARCSLELEDLVRILRLCAVPVGKALVIDCDGHNWYPEKIRIKRLLFPSALRVCGYMKTIFTAFHLNSNDGQPSGLEESAGVEVAFTQNVNFHIGGVDTATISYSQF